MTTEMDLFETCYSWQDAEMVKASGLYPYFHALSSSDGPIVSVDGKPVIMLGSNNYLGLTHHPAVLKAAHEAIDRFGTSCTGSRFLNGNLELHETLEKELAEFVEKEAAIVFPSGCLANFGTLGYLGSIEGAVVFSERENHGSIIDGLRLAKCEVKIYKSAEDLAQQLSSKPSWKNALVVTDAVTSMTGRVIDLKEIVELKQKFGFKLYVDDAHGFGVLGRNGRGTVDSQGITKDVDLLFATFSKSLASFGGFVAGEKKVIDFLRHHARTMIFSAGLPPASVASALAALRVLRQDDSLFERLWKNVSFFRSEATKLGYWTLGNSTPTAIVPLFVGSESLSFRLCREALDLGVFATPAIYPAVPMGQAVIRTSFTPAHTREQLEKALEVFAKLIKRYPRLKTNPGTLSEATELDFSYLLPQDDAQP